MDNASNRKQIREAEKAARRLERQRSGVLQSIMSTTFGREWIWAKMEAAHIFQTSFAEDAIKMAFLEGERNQGIALLNEIMQWCPEEFIQAMREANERRTQRRTTPAEHSGSEDGDWGTEEPEFDYATGAEAD